jgi:hypothetical protein
MPTHFCTPPQKPLDEKKPLKKFENEKKPLEQ